MEDPGGIGDELQTGLSPGTRLGKYQIVRLLGAGGMGAVYEASHTEIGKQVAVKVLSPAIAAVPGARARFLREAQLTSRVRHPNIVDVTDMGSDGGQTFLVMELLRGEDLGQRVARTGPLVPQQLVDIMLPVCSAVVEAHKAGITHRDLKPQNVFLAVGPHATQPKVLDFGISKGNDIVGASTGAAGSGSLTGTGAMIGTPYYLAPEQILDNRAAGPASDQYALGVIMYECLTGDRPFLAENLFLVLQAIVAGNPVPVTRRRPEVPAAFEAVVLRAMNLDPAARFPSIGALGRELLPFASSRTRSIWEEAFSTVHDVEAVIRRPPGTPAPLLTMGRPAAGATPRPIVSGAPRAAGVGGAAISPGGSGRVEGDREAVVPRPSRGGGGRPSISQTVPIFRGRRSRIVGATILGTVMAGGLVAGVVLRWSGGTDSQATTAGVPPPARATVPSPPTPDPAPVAVAKTDDAVAIRPPQSKAASAAAAAVKETEEEAAAAVVRESTFQASITVQPDDAVIEMDGDLVGKGRFDHTFPLDGTRHTVRVTAEGFDDRTLTFKDQPPPSTIRLSRTRKAPAARDDFERVPIYRPVRRIPTVQPAGSAPAALNPNGAPVID